MNAARHETQAFRDEFRATVPPSYSGIRHGVLLLLIGLTAIGVCVALLSMPLRWWDWAMVPLIVAGWNWLEWWGHARVLHRPGSNAFTRALYQRHTLTHHRFFTLDDANLRDARDLKIVFFPLFALPAIIAMASVAAGVLALAGFVNAGLMVVISAVSMYLLFEAFHLCAHLPDRAWLRHMPLVNTMRRHHRAHHDTSIMMTHNMNFTLPLADWYFDTCDLDRGLVGTVFNGCSERYVRRGQRARHADRQHSPSH